MTTNTNLLAHIGVDLDTALRWLDGVENGPWPKDFPITQPQEIIGAEDADTFSNPAWQIIWQGISNLIPMKERLRHHHIQRLGRTNEQFEEWWTNQGDKDWSLQQFLKKNPEASPAHFYNLDGTLK